MTMTKTKTRFLSAIAFFVVAISLRDVVQEGVVVGTAEIQKSISKYAVVAASPVVTAEEGAVAGKVSLVSNVASCLLIKDDNNRLSEWLAYHYQVLPLRFLVVAMDVKSVTSPQDILSLWNKTTDMEIHLWDVGDLLPADITAKVNDTSVTDRQEYFLSACLQYMKKHRATWVTSHDVDEFLTFNRFTASDPHWKERNETLLKQQANESALTLEDQSVLARTRVPANTGGDMSFSNFIAQEQEQLPWKYQSCVPITRLQFGAVATPVAPIPLLDGFDGNKLDTLRFLQHREKGKCGRNCKGKTLIDVARIPDNHLAHYHVGGVPKTSEFSPHFPVAECNRTAVPSYMHSVLRVHHYLGSEEAFFAKHDPRRIPKKFNWYKNLKSLPEFEATYWLKGFVESVGEKTARALLKGAGEMDSRLTERYQTKTTTSASPGFESNSTLKSKDTTKPSSPKVILQDEKKPQTSSSTVQVETAGKTKNDNDEDTYFFQCDDPRSNCTYFSPHAFYDTVEGAGYPFRERAHREDYGKPNRTLDANFCRALLKEGKMPPRPNFPTELTYIHNHKAGGITLKYSYAMFPADYRIGKNYTTEMIFTAKAWKLGEVKMQSLIKSFLDSSVLFSFVRDPIDRFVSAASEVISQGFIPGSTKKDCVGLEHGTETMKCFIDKLLAGEIVDAHLIPQSIELYQFAMGNPNVKISIFEIKSIGEVQLIMGIPPFSGNKKKGVKKQYTTKKLTQEMIRDLCKIYEMDVAMARAAGISVSRCP